MREIAPCELYVDDQHLVQYHFKCFERLVVPVIMGIIALERGGYHLCVSGPNSPNITVPAAIAR
jgi:hypothetical protein